MKRLQKYQRSKLEVGKKLPTRPVSNPMHSGPGWSGRFFSTSNFDLWYFCSLLTYKDVQYLVWKIWLISVWRMKAKVLLWLSTWFIFARSTLISYYTEAFVKTEVGCTVYERNLWPVDFRKNIKYLNFEQFFTNMVIVHHSAFCRSDMEVVVFPGNTSPVVNVYSEQSLAGSGCNASLPVWFGWGEKCLTAQLRKPLYSVRSLVVGGTYGGVGGGPSSL